MQTKLVEVHDDGSTFWVLAIKMIPTSHYERKVLHELGLEPDGSSVILLELGNLHGSLDPMRWPSLGTYPRTLPSAHKWIISNFEKMLPGEVIDVSRVLGANLFPTVPINGNAKMRVDGQK